MKILFLGLVLFLVQAQVFSYDCNTVIDKQTCIEINSSNLSQEEKDVLLSNIDYYGKFFPDHETIYKKNTGLLINDAPSGVNKVSSEFIKDAWVSIFAVMPSVLYNGSLVVPENCSVLTGFNYRLYIPSDYESSGYPEESEGDCRRTYELTKNVSENDVFVDYTLQGTGRFAPVRITSDSEIDTYYSINAAVLVSHYEWYTYCCREGDDGCLQYCHDCIHNYDEIKNDEVRVNDSLLVKKHDSNLIANIKVIDSYKNTTKIQLNYSNSFRISFEDSSYEYFQYYYFITYSKIPYYVFTLKAEDYNQEKINNTFIQGNNIFVTNTNNCSIMGFDFFKSINNSCDLNYSNINLSINTDKLKYKNGETISVNISPSNITARVSYGNQTIDAIGNASFSAEPLENKIIAEYNGIHAEKVIFVDPERLSILWNLCVLGILSAFFYFSLKNAGGFL